MTNKYKPINQKIACERNKKIWILKDLNGKIIDSFRQKSVAEKEKSDLERGEYRELIIERDNSIRNNLVKLK